MNIEFKLQQIYSSKQSLTTRILQKAMFCLSEHYHKTKLNKKKKSTKAYSKICHIVLAEHDSILLTFENEMFCSQPMLLVLKYLTQI